jgi:HEAT repeat protein
MGKYLFPYLMFLILIISALECARKSEENVRSQKEDTLSELVEVYEPDGKIKGQDQPKTQLQILIEELESPDLVARGSAAYRIGQLGPNAVSAVPFLIERLGDGWGLEWRSGAYGRPTSPGEEAMIALTKIGKLSVQQLINALQNEDMSIRAHAAEALGIIGDRSAVEPLIRTLKDKEYFVCGYAAWALAEIGDERMFEPLRTIWKELEDKDIREDEIHIKIAFGLAKMADVRALSLLANQSSSELNGTYAREALRKIGKPAVQTLIKVAKDKNKDRDIRNNAVTALGDIGDLRAVEPLIALLKEGDLSVWEALVDIGDQSVIKPCIELLTDEDPNIRYQANHVLLNITGQDFGEDYDKWTKWYESKSIKN